MLAFGLVPLHCPHCGALNTGHVDPDHPNKLPHAGDLSLCISCQRFSVFTKHDDRYGLRVPDTIEQREIDEDPDNQLALAQLRGVLE